MINLIINNVELTGFTKIEVCAEYNQIPNYFTADYLYRGDVNIKINDDYQIIIDGFLFQKGKITDLELHSSREYGKVYTVRGVDNNNYLLNNSCGFYNYLALYSLIPIPTLASNILKFFNIKHSFEVIDTPLFILPNTTDTLWSVVLKIAKYTNSNAVSNGNIIRFVNKFDSKINGFLLNKNTNTIENNIFSSELKLNFHDKINKVTTISPVAFSESQINNNINNDNDEIILRDILLNESISEYNSYLRKVDNYNLIEYCVNIKIHNINNIVPLNNSLIDVIDEDYNIDTSLLIIGLKFRESRKDGVQTDLKLVDPNIFSKQINKGSIGNKFIST